jgi:D-alanine-D-alanine ligase
MKKNTKSNGKARDGQKPLKPAIGPVQNLEDHLQPDWWKRIFNSMYLKTDSDVVEDETITRLELDMFTQFLGLTPDQVILDLACGQGRHTLGLARRGYREVYGLDRSHFLINRARQTSANEGLKVKFREGDARKLPYAADTFDVVMILGNSFGYFENLEDDLKVLKEVFRVLKPQGKFLLDLADGSYLKEHFNPRSWEWINKDHFVCRERSLASDQERLISREVISNTKKGVIVDQFYAERLYTRESIRALLKKAGFSGITHHEEYTTSSERNQDLGMMERRIIVSSIVIKEWSPKKVKSPDARNITVIMGDPAKADIIKPDTVFDEDDMITIRKLKSALSSLEGFRFTYLDNHDRLISDLVRLRPQTDLVLNLCDEGFDNLAKKELHVPALLEMMKLPYTGSNPQCLAYCYDKSLIRGIAKEMEIPVAEAFYINPGDNLFELNIEFPVITKPNFGDSSFGITQHSVAYTVEQLNDAIHEIRNTFGYDKPILVEEFLTGKDLSVGIIGNPPESYTVLPVIEEDYSQLPEGLPRICGYEAKWLADSPYFNLLRSVRADLDEGTEKQIVAWCLKLSERLDCRDYTRFDWRLDARGGPRLLEVNPNPGWCWDGHLAKMAGLNGMDYAAMLREILKEAETRISQESLHKSLATEVESNSVGLDVNR